MIRALKHITVLYGHSGAGKTNLALNLALLLSAQGEAVTLIDLDVVNPYFRSSDYTALLERRGIRVIAPGSAGTTLDMPALSAAIDGALDGTAGRILIDAGGDDLGAAALGRFAPQIMALGGWSALYIVNSYRILTQSAQEAAALLPGIEARSRLRASGIVNNSHLSAQTTVQDILRALPFAEQVARLTGLPLICTTAPSFLDRSALDGQSIFWLDRLVKNPWE